MLLNEKIAVIRKMNNLSQEKFAEELGVSRQAVSKWESGNSVPDVQMLLNIADYYNLTLDQLVRDDFDLPMAKVDEEKLEQNEENEKENDKEYKKNIQSYLGKVCDVSMNSFRYSVLRNIQIVGIYKNMVCFSKKNKLGYFNLDKSLGILVKKEADYEPVNEIILGKCSAYVNKGTYFGGNTYMMSKVTEVKEDGITLETGSFVSEISFEDLSVILMSE